MGEDDSDDEGSVANAGSELTVDSTTTDGDLDSEFGSPAPSSARSEDSTRNVSQSQTITSTTDHSEGAVHPPAPPESHYPPPPHTVASVTSDRPAHCSDSRLEDTTATSSSSSGLTSLTSPVKSGSAPLMVS